MCTCTAKTTVSVVLLCFALLWYIIISYWNYTFTDVLQCCFTGTGPVLSFPGASERILQNPWMQPVHTKIHESAAHRVLRTQLDMSTARRRLKSPRSLPGTSTHPTMVTLDNIMVMNKWLTSFSFHDNQPPYSWDKAISNSWNSKVKVMGVFKGQAHTVGPILFPFHFTSIGPTIIETQLFRNFTLIHPWSRS